MTKRLLIVAALLLSVAVTACGDSSSSGASPASSPQKPEGSPPAQPTGTLRVALAGQPQSLDPSLNVQIFEVPLMTALYDGLLTRKPESYEKLSPALATAYKSNADATRWTFTLRQGVKFSDGEAFDAAAAKKSIQYYQRDGSVLSFALGPIAGVSAPDPQTLVVSFKQPFPDFAGYTPLLKMLAPKLLRGTPAQAAKRVGSTAAGTGPYVLDSFSPSRITMHANPDYWDDGPHIAKLDFRAIPEESARNAALQSGDTDLLLGVSPRTAQTLRSSGNVTLTSVKSWQTYALNLATAKKPLDDVRVRQALAYAVNRQAIAKSIMLGQADVTGSLAPPGTYGYRKPATQYGYDPAKAKALLAQAGVSTPVRLRLVVFDSVPDGRLLVDAIADQAKAAGFDLKVAVMPAGAAGSDVAKPQRKNDIYLFIEGAVNGGPFHLAAGVITGNASYKGKALLGDIAKVNALPNGSRREAAIATMIEQAAKDVPEIPMFSLTVTDASTKALQNHVPSRDGFLTNWSEPWLTR